MLRLKFVPPFRLPSEVSWLKFLTTLLVGPRSSRSKPKTKTVNIWSERSEVKTGKHLLVQSRSQDRNLTPDIFGNSVERIHGEHRNDSR